MANATSQPVPAHFPRTIEAVIVYEVAKDHGNHDRPFISAMRRKAVGQGNDCLADVTQLVLSDSVASFGTALTPPTNPANVVPVDLPFKLVEGNNLYLFRLANGTDGEADTQAKFGPATAPMQTLPDGVSKAGNGFIKQLGLYFIRNGSLSFYADNNIPGTLDAVPDDAWLGFVCQASEAKTRWDELHPKGGEGEFSFPVYLNLYDRQEKCPCWGIDDDHGEMNIMVHGGIHPSTLSSSLNA